MSETVIENVVQTPVKKKWKASTVRIAFAIFILIPFVAVWAGMQNIDSLVIVDFLFFFGLAMYGKISGKLETGASKSNFETTDFSTSNTSLYRDGPFLSDVENLRWRGLID